MNTLQKSMIALAAGSLLTVGAQAAPWNTASAGQPYVGVKVGQANVDIDNASTKKPTAYGVYGGYNFDPNFGVEVEYVGSGKADFNRNATPNIVGEYDMKTYGAYGTYRYNFADTPIYGKAKLGVARTEVSGSTVGYNYSSNKTGIAGGVGLGYNVSPNFSVEAEYAMAGSDAKLLSVGAHLKF